MAFYSYSPLVSLANVDESFIKCERLTLKNKRPCENTAAQNRQKHKFEVISHLFFSPQKTLGKDFRYLKTPK